MNYTFSLDKSYQQNRILNRVLRQEIGKILYEYRQQQNLSLDDMCAKYKILPHDLNDIEKCSPRPSWGRIIHILSRYNLDLIFDLNIDVSAHLKKRL